MSKKQKALFRFSIAINIILILVIVWGYIHINLAMEQLFFTEVQESLVELEGLIEHEKNNNWSEPNLVTTKLNEVLNGIELGIHTGTNSKWISEDDQAVLGRLSSRLRQYPTDSLYQFAEVTQNDQKNFEELQQYLREAGLGLNITISNDWDIFMKQAQILERSIPVPLNE
ncbi:hypothetical protein [Bacillus sp. S/N-304-OC-R1]|uniref:hypothetical protein n=1 Tax=Bacillus sp. S/N-304-OC-R1 TaxID=2758034 RepID=UPI001C8E4F91|nr:hypothetical protein [Bacillus sp. S/N-304-OC-R1]MBY0122034.1 hypothetical protein [Bacillus sp. S/N-304-OC-R1]